jgi:aminoglycoside phosphotransferase (APT) family kinase protein
MCVYRHPALDVILGIPAAWTSPRLPGPDDLAQTYTLVSGRDLGDWPFYLGLAHLKLAVIAEGIAHRARAGADAGRDAHRAAEAVPELVAAGVAALGTR